MDTRHSNRWDCKLRAALMLAAALWLPAGHAAELTIAVLDHGQVLERATRTVLTEAYGRRRITVKFKEMPAARCRNRPPAWLTANWTAWPACRPAMCNCCS